MEKRHSYDIIIPIYHPGKIFDRVLDMLKKQEPAPEKIILLETLDDGEAFVSYEDCVVVTVRKEDYDHAATRRLGVSYSSAEAFIMMTQDAIPVDTKLCANLLDGLYAWEKSGKDQKANEEQLQKIIQAYRQSAIPDDFGSGLHPEDKLRVPEKKKRTKKVAAKPPIDSTSDMDPDTSSWDNVPTDQYVRLIREHENSTKNFPALPDGRIAMCYARQIPTKNCNACEKFTRSFNYPAKSFTKSIVDVPELGIKAFFASDVCCAYNRDMYESIMGFDPKAIFNEDMLYAAKAMKQGYHIAYAANAMVIHSHNYSILEQYHRNFDNGMSQAMHPEVFGGISSEGEGKKLVKATAAHLFKEGKGYMLPKLLLQSGFKYLGFKAGKNYKKYSYAKLRRLALNKTFIDRHFKSDR